MTVNAIQPGGFLTGPNGRGKETYPAVIAWLERRPPMSRVGDPADVPCDASRYMTGAALVIDSGYPRW